MPPTDDDDASDEEKNEIEELIDGMISGGDELAATLVAALPEPLGRSVSMFQESNAANLRRIRDFLNR